MTDIKLTADRYKVTATEQVSTDEYANYRAHTAIEGDINMAGPLDDAARRQLKALIMAVHASAQDSVARSGENRLADDPDWSVRGDE